MHPQGYGSDLSTKTGAKMTAGANQIDNKIRTPRGYIRFPCFRTPRGRENPKETPISRIKQHAALELSNGLSPRNSRGPRGLAGHQNSGWRQTMETDKDSRTFSRQADARVVIPRESARESVLLAPPTHAGGRVPGPSSSASGQGLCKVVAGVLPCRMRRAAVLMGRAVLFPSV